MLISNPQFTNGQFSVTVLTSLSKSYQLEFTTNATSTNWEPLPAIPGTGDEMTLTDPEASSPRRFYRVREF